jgi:hypothetical protein
MQSSGGCVEQNGRSTRRRRLIPVRSTLPADAPIFDVPAGLLRILDRDLLAAGIPKRDDRDRTVDVHALRTSFGTHLSKAGVEPRTAQAAMRHSDIGLTMNVYTDPRLLDVAGAVERLPDLPLAAGDRTAAKATGAGTDAGAAGASPQLPPQLPLPAELSSKFLVTAGNNAKADGEIQKQKNPQFSKENQGFSGDSASRGERIRTFDLLVPKDMVRPAEKPVFLGIFGNSTLPTGFCKLLQAIPKKPQENR